MRAAIAAVAWAIAFGWGASRAEGPKPGKRVIDGGTVVVTGKVHRPQAVIVFPKPRVSYEWPELVRRE